MIKKFQQYLLINHPLLWNIKIFPLVITAIILNISFFGFGYIFTDIDFNNRYSNYDSLIFDKPLLLFSLVLIIATALIIWLVNYSKNNAFKVFYPKTTSSLYFEWILTFIIVGSMLIIPFSFQKGVNTKIKTYATKEEAMKAVEIINMVNYLVPESKQTFFKEYPDGYRKNKQGELEALQKDDYQESSYYNDNEIDSIVKESQIRTEFKDFPNFNQLSLLNRNTNYDKVHLYSWRYDFPEDFKLRGMETVRQWLIDENRKDIESLIDSFLQLSQRHNLRTNLTREKWMQLVYNPSKYPVGDFNIIYGYDVVRNGSGDYDEETGTLTYGNYVPLEELANAYSTIFEAHYDRQTSPNLLLALISISGIMSLLVFSFRSTNGKSWLIALVVGGILTISAVLLTIFVHEINLFRNDSTFLFFISFWLILFTGELIYIITLNNKKNQKRFSNISINHLLWMMPFIPVLILLIIIFCIDNNYNSYYDSEYGLYKQHPVLEFIENHIIELIWANILLTFFTVWLFIKTVLRKWKSLPEQ